MKMIHIDSENCFIKIAIERILASIPYTEIHDLPDFKMAAVVEATPSLTITMPTLQTLERSWLAVSKSIAAKSFIT